MNEICWVNTVSDEEATGAVKTMFDAVRCQGAVENLYRAGSLFPEPVAIADRLYKAIMHDEGAPLALWECELAATYVAILCECRYAATHHGANFVHLFGARESGDFETAKGIIDDLRKDVSSVRRCNQRTTALLSYTRKLTCSPGRVEEQDISALRLAGLSDAEIVHLNQVVASFAYWVRIINGLGIELADGVVGLFGEVPQG